MPRSSAPDGPSHTASWDALFDGLLADREEIVREIRRRIQGDLPVFREIDEATMDRDVQLSFMCTIESARGGSEAVSATEVAALVEVGRSQAEAGVPLERAEVRLPQPPPDAA